MKKSQWIYRLALNVECFFQDHILVFQYHSMSQIIIDLPSKKCKSLTDSRLSTDSYLNKITILFVEGQQ